MSDSIAPPAREPRRPPESSERDAATSDVVEQEIKHEQAVVDRVYARLEAAADAARALQREGHARASVGNEGGLVERDAIVFQAGKRLATLDAAHEGLVFGRLDHREDEIRYIGRLGLRDAEREVLLVDWRAPAASVFYQATAQDPSGVVRRRVLQSIAEQVVGVQDDLLDPQHAPDDMVVVGEGALLAELARSRDQTMHSVVATIQREQDDAIRAPHRGVTEITGGPGTGKTVVALHRAAYLLYTDRRRYEGGGVLVVGPNAVFMSYIQRVLPSLGETTVTLRALGEVVDGVAAARHDVPRVALLKGSARIRRVLARTVRGAVPGAPLDFRIFYRDDVLRFDARDLAGLRRGLLDRWHQRNRAESHVADALIDALWAQVGGERALSRGKDEFANTMLGDRAFTAFVDRWWPVVGAVDVLGWLADRDRLQRDSNGMLSRQEVDDLVEAMAAEDFSVEDVPLLDELRYLLGERPKPEQEDDPLADLHDEDVPELTTVDQRRPAPATTPDNQRPTGTIEDDTYAHVLVDEAQDLTPMQWRMLGRRGRYASWTVVGDAAQSSWPLPEEAAQARYEALGDKQRNTFRLSTNYRNSQEIYALAAEVARASIPDADVPTAVRVTGVEPAIRTVPTYRLREEVVDAVEQIATDVDGTLGVVVPIGRRSEVEGWLPDRDRDRVSVLEALDTKGLEFDAVMVLEPDALVAEADVGMRTLYVVLTRATQRLELLGSTHDWIP